MSHKSAVCSVRAGISFDVHKGCNQWTQLYQIRVSLFKKSFGWRGWHLVNASQYIHTHETFTVAAAAVMPSNNTFHSHKHAESDVPLFGSWSTERI